ncbi:hypothetical protein Tco_1062450, partial [Tanacetum coccineum]
MACMNLQVQNCPLGCDSKINDLNKLNDNLDRLYNDCYIKVQAYQNAVKTLESQRAWYQNNQLAYEEKIRVLQRDLENTSNELKYSEKINAEIKMEKQDLQAKLDNSLSRFNKWKESSKNLAKLIDNSLSVKSKLVFPAVFIKDKEGILYVHYGNIGKRISVVSADGVNLVPAVFVHAAHNLFLLVTIIVSAGYIVFLLIILHSCCACTARQMVFSSPWLTAKKESGSPLQTALVCNSNPLIA